MKYPLFIVAILMSACAATAFDEPGPVVVAQLEMGDALGEFGMTRDELEVQLRRFADRYMTRIAVVTSETDKQPMTTAEKKLMQGWKTASFAAVIDIAIGPDAVTDLLDMMTLTLLSRMVAEDYWVPLDRIFVLLPLLICIFFAGLFGYRYMVHRLTRAQVLVQ